MDKLANKYWCFKQHTGHIYTEICKNGHYRGFYHKPYFTCKPVNHISVVWEKCPICKKNLQSTYTEYKEYKKSYKDTSKLFKMKGIQW